MKLFLDIDTQIDFLFPAGALYSPGAERVIAPVAKLNRHAAANGIPLISTMCAHSENSAEFADWPPHCVVGTVGQRKPAATLVEKRVVVPSRPGADIDLSGAQQIIVEKDELDVFTNPNFSPLLDRIGADEFYVYGVLIEYCVRRAIAGLLKRGADVSLVSEATAAADDAHARAILDTFVSSGLKLLTLEQAVY